MPQTKVKKIVMDDGYTLEYKEQPKEVFTKHFAGNPYMINHKFNNQYREFEEKILSHLSLDIEEFAIDEYSLIPERKQKTIGDFGDDTIEAEFISRGLVIEDHHIQNENITNESFVTRFINVINRGNDAEIENALTMLEKKYRIK